jgi:type VI secretion system secreted protein Hcp
MSIYMKYGAIKGDVTAAGHQGSDGWVEINSFQYGIGRAICSASGGSKDREASAPSISEINITKPTDISSTAWMEQALYGRGVNCQIDFCKTDKGQLEVYQSFSLENCLISGFTVNSGGDRPTESITISFTKIIYSYQEMSAAGDAGDSPKTGWDIGRACPV